MQTDQDQVIRLSLQGEYYLHELISCLLDFFHNLKQGNSGPSVMQQKQHYQEQLKNLENILNQIKEHMDVVEMSQKEEGENISQKYNELRQMVIQKMNNSNISLIIFVNCSI